MTENHLSVTSKRDTSGVTDRDSLARARTPYGVMSRCHAVTHQTVTVTDERDTSTVTAQPAARASLLPLSKHCRYHPHQVLGNQILTFFDTNRDEELTSADVAVKFGRLLPRVRMTLKNLTDAGLLDRYGVRNVGGQITYFYRHPDAAGAPKGCQEAS